MTVDGKEFARRLIAATNAFDVYGALAMFAPSASIDDVSVGEKFEGAAGVRRYLEQFFVGYNTVSKILSVTEKDAGQISIRLDFTGDFGRETGVLDVSVDAKGLITEINAYLD